VGFHGFAAAAGCGAEVTGGLLTMLPIAGTLAATAAAAAAAAFSCTVDR